MKLESKWQALIVVSIGIFMSTLDGSILNIANPTIAKSFNVSMQQIQWVITAYMLIITASLIFFGRLGDRLGSEKIYSTGFFVFVVGSFFCSIASSLASLITARLVQGIGASMLMATGMGIISNTFPTGERGKALGLTGMIVGLGNMTGPSLGGLLITKFAWPIIFLINIPIGLIGFFLALRHLPRQSRNPNLNGHDLPGTFLFALITGLIIYGVADAANINSIYIITVLLLMPLFCWVEKRSPQPIIDFELLKIKNFIYGNAMALGIYVTQMAVFFILPFYMETIIKLTPAKAGLLLTITPICMAITAPLAGTLSDKIGSRRILSFSLFLTTGAYMVFANLNDQLYLPLLISGLALLGIGIGMFGSPNNNSIFASVPREKAGYVGGFIATNRNLSFALGTAGSAVIFSWLLNSAPKTMAYNSAYIHALHKVYILAAIITGIAFLISIVSRLGDSAGNSTLDTTKVTETMPFP